MNPILKTLLIAAVVAPLAGAGRVHAQARVNWIGAPGVEAAWNQGDLGAGQGTNWQSLSMPTEHFQPDRNFSGGEYGSISNGGVALVNQAIGVSPAGIRLGEDAASTGSLVVRDGGSITVLRSADATGADPTDLGILANGVAGAGTLVLRGNMGAVSVESYSQNAASTLVAQVASASSFASHVNATSQIGLGGTLRIERSPASGFVASAGNSWTLMDGAPVTGSFASVVVDAAVRGNSGQFFGVSTAGNAVTVSVEQRLVLQIDRFTGAAKIVNPTGHATNIAMIGYTLRSAQNGVDGSNARWTSLTDAGVAGWFEANPTSTALSELNPLGSLTINPGQTSNLGTPVNVNAGAALGASRVNTGDVSLQYQLTTGQLVDAIVEPVGRFNDLVLVVNPATGGALIQNQSAQSVGFISYTISSASGSLKTNWTGLEGLPLANWFKANPTTTNLSELNTTGVATMNVGNELNLGVAWDSLLGSRDLTFNYQTTDGVLRAGTVHFGDKAVVSVENGDFDGDHDVDGADFLVWQRGLGLMNQTNRTNGDANGDGTVNGSDLTIWKAQFGSTNAPTVVAAASVPEPSGIAIALVAALLTAFRKRGRQ